MVVQKFSLGNFDFLQLVEGVKPTLSELEKFQEGSEDLKAERNR